MNWICRTKRRLKKTAFLSLLVKLYPIGFDLAISMLVAAAVENALEGAISRVAYLGIIAIALLVFVKATNTSISVKFQKYVTEMKHSCKMELYHEYMSNPLFVLYQTGHGSTIENLNDDFDSYIQRYTEYYPSMLASVVGAVTYFLFLVGQSWLIAVTLLAISLLQVLPPLIIKRFLQTNYDNCRNIEAKITDFTLSGYQGFLTIKSYHLQEWWIEKLKKLHKEYLRIGSKSEITSALDDMITNTVDNILKYGTYGIIGLFALFQLAALEVGIQAITLSSYFYQAVKGIFTPVENLAVSKMAQKRISAILPESDSPGSPLGDADLHFENVSFEYAGNSILNGLNFTLHRHEITLIKGPNGIGKSTLLKLIAGLIRCDSGKITIDQAEMAALPPAAYPEKLFYLTQEDPNYDFPASELFQMSAPGHLVETLRLAKEFRMEDTAVKTVKIRDLSGGEKKKAFLSLAFAIHPAFLLLDEPTNSLDQAAVQTVVKLLQTYKGTVLIVTHENCFDAVADQCLLMEKGGSLVERKK